MGGGGLGQRGYTSEKLNLKPLVYLPCWCCGCGLGAGFICAFGALRECVIENQLQRQGQEQGKEQGKEQGSEGYRAAKKYTTTMTKNAKMTCTAMLTGLRL
jgi:hypothetical protein